MAVKSGREQSWEELKNTDAAYPEPYKNGLHSLGEKLQERAREPEKELIPTVFSSMVSNDPWRTQVSNSSSIRSYHAINSHFRMRNAGKNVLESPIA